MNPAASFAALRAPLRRAVATGPSSVPRTRAAIALYGRGLSSTAVRLNEQKSESADGKKDEQSEAGKKKDEKKRSTAEDDGPPQSPWKVFMQVFKEEIDKNQGWQNNVKQLQGDVDKLADSTAMRKARTLYERNRVSTESRAGRAAVVLLLSFLQGSLFSEELHRRLPFSTLLTYSTDGQPHEGEPPSAGRLPRPQEGRIHGQRHYQPCSPGL